MRSMSARAMSELNAGEGSPEVPPAVGQAPATEAAQVVAQEALKALQDRNGKGDEVGEVQASASADTQEWSVGQKIGEGGFAVVYRAMRLCDGRAYAIKLTKDSRGAEETVSAHAARRLRLYDSLETERKALRSVQHRNVVRITDFEYSQPNGSPAIVMELMKGSLRDVLRRCRTEPRKRERAVSDAFRDTLQALDFIHSKGIIHCDVKSDNIMFYFALPGEDKEYEEEEDQPQGNSSGGGGATNTTEGEIKPRILFKLGDFGLARAPTGGGRACEDAAGHGTPTHAPPEAWRDGVVGPGTDVWALHVVLAHALDWFGIKSCAVDDGLHARWARLPHAYRVDPRIIPWRHMVDHDPARRPAPKDLLDTLERTMNWTVTHPDLQARWDQAGLSPEECMRRIDEIAARSAGKEEGTEP